MTLSDLKNYAEQHLAAIDASFHQHVRAFLDFVEGKESLKQQIADATALLQANGFTVTQN